MSRSLPDGLVVVVCKTGHCGHRTSLPQNFNAWGFTKKMVRERKVNGREELHERIFDAARRKNDPDVVRKVKNILNFKHP
jgi:hypothetical protein